MKHRLKQFISFIASLRVAIVLLILIALYIVIGTLLPQHSVATFYHERYPTWGPLILALSLDTAYSSLIFTILLILFTVNLTLCTILSLRGQLRQMDGAFFPSFKNREFVIEEVEADRAKTYLNRHRYRIVEEDGVIKGGKFRFGVLGAAITHLGIIILFLGGAGGAFFSSEDMVTLLPGNHHHFDAKGFTLQLDDFYMTFEPSGAIKQYISEVTLIDESGERRSEQLWVNKPLHHKGLGFYQANWGWTSNLRITNMESNTIVAEGLLRNDTVYFYQDNHLTVHLYGYYPELGIGHEGQPVRKSEREIDPYYAVILYEFGNPIGSYIIAPGDPIIHENLQITFTHSIAYTGLLVRSDLSYPIVLTSFIIMILGIIISFYFYPRFIKYEDGVIIPSSRRNGWIFYNSVKRAITEKD